MPVSTDSGQYHESDFDYWHEQMFGPQQQEEQPKGEGKTFLVRHGDTAMNDEDLVHGWVDAPLNERGIEQAHKAAESLKDKNITRIISSDLPRAKQTANIISKTTGIPVIFDPNLRTWDSGDFDGTDKHSELKKYAHEDSGTKPPGSSESFDDFKDRAIGTIAGYAMNGDGQNTAIVSHSKAIGVFDAWEHAGYPEDGSIHMATYDQAKDTKPGGHQEIKIPDQIQPDNLPYSLRDDNASFDQRFAGWPQGMPVEVPGESYDKQPLVYGTLKGLTGKPPEWPGEEGYGDSVKMNTPYYPDVDPSKIQNITMDESMKHPEISSIPEGGGFRGNTSTGSSGGRIIAPDYAAEGKARNEKIIDSVINKGKTYQETADELGIPRNTVAGTVKRWRDNPESGKYESSSSNKYGKGYWQEGGEGSKKLIELHRSGKNPVEISEELGINESNVRSMLRERDLVPNRVPYGSKVKTQIKQTSSESPMGSKLDDKVTDARNDKTIRNNIRRLYEKGTEYEDIAKETGLDESVVRGVVAKEGMGRRPQRVRPERLEPKENRPSRDKLLELLKQGIK